MLTDERIDELIGAHKGQYNFARAVEAEARRECIAENRWTIPGAIGRQAAEALVEACECSWHPDLWPIAAALRRNWGMVEQTDADIRKHPSEAERDALRSDAERYRWLRSRVTYYNVDADWPVEAPNVPTLAQVSERIWYHATDDIVHDTLDAVIDAARTEGKG